MKHLALGLSLASLVTAWIAIPTQPAFACACAVIALGLVMAIGFHREEVGRG